MAFTIDWTFVVPLLERFGMFVGGMLLYAVFIFSFYKHVSKRLLFELKPYDGKGSDHPGLVKAWLRFTYALKYIFLSPFLFFLWGAVITVLLLIFDGSTPIPVETTLLISMALLATIRITAYITEELSSELAKNLPLAMLAVFLVDMNAISVPAFFSKLQQLPGLIPLVAFYFGCVVLLELLLRLYDALVNRE